MREIGFIVVLVIGVFMFGVFVTTCGTISNIATTPQRTINKVVTPDNIVYNYEWFYDVNAQYEARLNQIRAWNDTLAAETDVQEQRKLRMELQAMRQSCRGLATSYNANSSKVTRTYFKGWSLPETISLEACE